VPTGRNRAPYELLAAVYERDWGGFSDRFLRFIDLALEKAGTVPSTALDLACGTGGLALALAGRGWRVVGLDLSPAMIRVACGKGSSAEFQVGDMRSFDLGTRFDLVTCAFDSFNYLLSLDEVRAAFRCVRTHLQPGGLFLFDLNTPSLYEAHHHGIIERDVEDVAFRQELRYEAKERLAYTTFRFDRGVEVHVQRAYEREEIESQLRKAGLRSIAVHGDMRGAPATRASERLFLTATADDGG
jgi:SAM-dependent methyltransferase